MRSYKSTGSLNINKDIDKPLLGSPSRESKNWNNTMAKIAEENDHIKGLGSRFNSPRRGATLRPVEREEIGECATIINNTDKAIDFNAQLEQHKARTESQFPYTMTQTEDAMYLDSSTICTLEYHYIQNDCRYTQLSPIEEKIVDGKLVDEEGNLKEYVLATQNYQPDGATPHPMSIFQKKDITNYKIDEESNIYQDMWKEQDRGGLMKAFAPIDFREVKRAVTKGLQSMMNKRKGNSPEKGEKKPESEDLKVQPFIGIYKVTPEGRMARMNEFAVNMGRRNYKKAKDGSMMLTRSKDKRYVSITNFDPMDKDD